MTSLIALDGVISFLRLKDVTITCKRRWRSLSIGRSSSVQWRKVGRSWRLQMCFRRLLCFRIEIDQLHCVNCWVIIHCLSVSCTTINHLRWALVIWSSLQLTSKQWIITQQFTAGADLFLKYCVLSESSKISSAIYIMLFFPQHIFPIVLLRSVNPNQCTDWFSIFLFFMCTLSPFRFTCVLTTEISSQTSKTLEIFLKFWNQRLHTANLRRQNWHLYTTFTNFSMKYHLMCKVYTDVGGKKSYTVFVHLYTR